MRKKIENMVEPVLLDLFDSFDFGWHYSIMEIKSKLNNLFNQIDNKKISSQSYQAMNIFTYAEIIYINSIGQMNLCIFLDVF